MGADLSKAAKPTLTRSTRFPADPNDIANLTLTFAHDNSETFVGLVKNESKTGCCVVLVTTRKIHEDTDGICRVGNLPYAKVRVRWIKKISHRVFEVGLCYLS